MVAARSPVRAFPPCAPVADLFLSQQAFIEPHTRRQMAALCFGCPIFADCDKRGDEAMTEQRRRQRNYMEAPAYQVGFRAGLTPTQRGMRLSKRQKEIKRCQRS